MKIMAVDLGDSRTGLAVCDKTEFLASPVGTIHEKNFNLILQKVAYATKEYDVKEVVVGYPKNMDGSIGERAEKCEKFAKMLGNIIEIPVKLWDERSTTVSAINILNETNTRGKKRKEVIDSVAATIILESYLQFRKNEKK
jgi:putative Holliday junction resolvase